MLKRLARKVLKFASAPLSRGGVAADNPLEVWARRGWASPAPNQVKWEVFKRFNRRKMAWIESGTFLGDTTQFLAGISDNVVSIEPSEELYDRARVRFQTKRNVKLIHGLSEDTLHGAIDQVGPSKNVGFWLDGHFSAGLTFKGPTDTPIREELAIIERNLERLGDVTVLVDDFRDFVSSSGSSDEYPAPAELVKWASNNGMNWTVEHDIFVAWRLK